MGCGSAGSTTQATSTTTSPPPQVMAAYQGLINQGTAVAQAPLQQYQGPVIAGFNPTQQTAFNEVNQAQGAALPYLNAAQTEVGAGTTPIMSQVQGFPSLGEYENPYTQQVTQATQNLFNQQNAQQFNQANAAAASAGAFGGDRQAVLQAQMAQQQQLAEAPVLAQLQSAGFAGAEQELNTQQNLQLQGASGTDWLNQNAAGLEANLGSAAQNALLSGASNELQVGGLQQQLQQEELNVPLAQFEQQQAYPFQTTDFLAGLVEGTAPGMGGTSTNSTPGPNTIGQVAGLGIAGLGAYEGAANNASSTGAGFSGALFGDGTFANTAGAFATAVAQGGGVSGGNQRRRRGGRSVSRGFPILRDAGGPIPTVFGGFPPLSSDDVAAVNEALQLAAASPVTMPPNDGKPLAVNVLPGGGGSGGSSSSGASSALSTIASMAPMIAAMFMRRGGTVPHRALGGNDPSIGPMGGTANILSSIFGTHTGNLLAGLGGDWLGFVNMANNPQLTQLVDPLQILRRGGRAGFPRGFADADPTGDVGDGSSDSQSAVTDDGQSSPIINASFSPNGQTTNAGTASTPSPANTAGSSGTGGSGVVPGATFRDAGNTGGFPRMIVPPRQPPSSNGSGSWLSNPLVAIGAGMMSSRSPFILGQIGDGLQAGIKSNQQAQQTALDRQKANAPHVDSSGDTMKLIYPDGSIFDTGIPTRSTKPQNPPKSPQPSLMPRRLYQAPTGNDTQTMTT